MNLSEIYDQRNKSGWLYLCEAPQQIGDVDWNLSDPKVNAEHRDKLLASHPTSLGDFAGVKLYRRKGQIFAIDPHDNNDLVYWVKTDVRKINVIGTTAICQRALWRNTNNASTNGLPEHIFFDVWLKTYDAIVTDGMQTTGGKNFWFRRVKDAFALGHSVYYARELSPQTVVKLKSFAEFQRLALDGTIWGTTPDYKHRLVVITTKTLDER
jgi:hypothetical protein